MEYFIKIVNYFRKNSTLDVWQGSECASDLVQVFKYDSSDVEVPAQSFLFLCI